MFPLLVSPSKKDCGEIFIYVFHLISVPLDTTPKSQTETTGPIEDIYAAYGVIPMNLNLSRRLNVIYYATFGANRRSTLYAILIEGITLFGILSLSETGYIQFPEVPNLTIIFVSGTLLTLFLMYLLVRSISRETLSPRLQLPLIQLVLVGWYAALGLSTVGAGFVLSSYIAGEFSLPATQELAVGIGIGCFYGLLILIYYDRYVVDTPNKRDEFQRLGAGFLESYDSLSGTDRSPLQLTDDYSAFLCRADELVDLLEKAETPDGKQLYHDMREWTRKFESHREPAQDIVINGGNDRKDELQTEHENLSDVIGRIKRLTKHGSA